MAKEDSGYLDYSATKTYCLKIRNIKKIDKLAKDLKINKSKALNKIIEAYSK